MRKNDEEKNTGNTKEKREEENMIPTEEEIKEFISSFQLQIETTK